MHSLITTRMLLVAMLVCWAHAASAATVSVGTDKVIRVDGQAFFPIMQWAQCGSRIAYQSALGINTFVGNGCSGDSSAEFLADCAASDVWGVVSSGDMSVSNHASLLGWVFGDEPDLQSHQTEPADVLTEYNSIKSQDPNHITFLTLTARFYSGFNPPDWMEGSRDRYYDYGAASDVIGFDHYPVYGWCRPDWIDQIGSSHDELIGYAPNPATYQWIEASSESGQYCELCDRCSSPVANCSRDNPCADDGVRADEMRNEVWQAIVHGATAIGYFTHAWECPAYTQFCLSSELEAEMTRTNGQISALAEVLLSPAYSGSVTATAGNPVRIDVSVRASGNQLYIVVVNSTREAQQVEISVAGMSANSSVEVYDEARQVQATGTQFSDSFEPLAVHIYRAPLANAVDAGSADRAGADTTGTDTRLADASGNDGGNRDSAADDVVSTNDAAQTGTDGGNNVDSGDGRIGVNCACSAASETTLKFSGIWVVLVLWRRRRNERKHVR